MDGFSEEAMSDFGHYWQVVQRAMPRLLLISAAIAIVAALIVRAVGPTHQVHFSYLISLSEREAESEYRFDGYYALSATDLFATTLAEWIKTPEVIVSAYRQAGIEPETSDPRVLVKAVDAVRSAPQLVAVTVRHADQQMAERLASGLREVMRENVEQYHDQGIPALRFRVVATEPWLGTRILSAPVIVTATFVFALFMSINVVIFKESLKGL